MSELPAERCLIAEMVASNAGDRDARSYLQDMLETKKPPPANTIGEEVGCERCFAVFRLNAGGVYLETAGLPCDEPKGMRDRISGWQLNLDYTHLY